MSGLYFPPVIVNGRINFPNPLFQTYGAPHQTVVWRPFMPGVVNPLGSNILYTGNMISPAIHNLRPIYGNSTSLGSNLHINLHSLTNPLPSSAVGLQASLFTCSPHVGMSLEMKKEVTGEKRKIEEDSEHRDRKKSLEIRQTKDCEMEGQTGLLVSLPITGFLVVERSFKFSLGNKYKIFKQCKSGSQKGSKVFGWP